MRLEPGDSRLAGRAPRQGPLGAFAGGCRRAPLQGPPPGVLGVSCRGLLLRALLLACLCAAATALQESHRAPQDSHGAPQDSHGAPQESDGAPEEFRGSPQESREAPQGAPAGAPLASVLEESLVGVSFVTEKPVTLNYSTGARVPPVCKQAGCRKGASHGFFALEKQSCFSITSCGSCPPHPEGLPRICSLHGKRKGYQVLMQNVLIPGAPPNAFHYRKATPEEIRETIPKAAPLGGPGSARSGGDGGGGAAASETRAAPAGPEETEEFADEGEEEWPDDSSQGQPALIDLTKHYPCSSSSSGGVSFVQNMPGFDTYEPDESGDEAMAGMGSSNRSGGSWGGPLGSEGGGPSPEVLTEYKQKRLFSLAPSGVVGSLSNCLVDHKGQTRVQVAVLLSKKDPSTPRPFILNTFGPNAEASGGTRGRGPPGDDFGEGGQEPDWADGEEAYLQLQAAAATQQQQQQQQESGVGWGSVLEAPRGLLSSLLQLGDSGIGRFFKRGGSDDDDDGGDDTDIEPEKPKRGGFLKRLFGRRKSETAREDEDASNRSIDDDSDEDGQGPPLEGRPKDKNKEGLGKKLRRKLSKASGALMAVAAPGGPSTKSMQVELSLEFASPAALKCSTPAVWQGRLRDSSLVRVVFNLRTVWAEVRNAFEDFVSSGLALEVTCKSRGGCLLEDSLISCVQVSCPKRREVKADIRDQVNIHRQIAAQQLQKVAQVLQKAGGPEGLNKSDRIKVAKAYAERMRQQQQQQQEQEQQQKQLLLQQIHQHQQLELQRQQQHLLQQQLLQQQRPAAPQIVTAGDEGEWDEEQQTAESNKEAAAPPHPRTKINLKLQGAAPDAPLGLGPWMLSGGCLLLSLWII